MPKGKPFELRDDDCERLNRSQMILVQRILAFVSDLAYAKDDLAGRMKSVPHGQERLNMVVGGAESLFRDLLGTISDKQRRQIRNAARDYVMVLQPKLTPGNTRISLANEDFKELVEMARYKCRNCAEDGEGARKCPLYQWLEANVPLEDYGDGLVCPYYTIGWED